MLRFSFCPSCFLPRLGYISLNNTPMPEIKDACKTQKSEDERFSLRRRGYLLLSSISSCLLSFLFFLPGFQTPCAYNEQGQTTKVKLATYFEFIPTQHGGEAIFQGVIFPVFSFLVLISGLIAVSSSFLNQEEKGDKRYFLSMIAFAFLNAFEGVFYLSFNHLLMMGASLFSSLVGILFAFLHYKKYVSY